MLDSSMNEELVRMVRAERLAAASRWLSTAGIIPAARPSWRQRLGRLMVRIGSAIDPESRPVGQSTVAPVPESAPAC
ncbi:MAG: hypothetical protein AVDCRST_MAG33-240 [uncultured Thermomicrobiales bacterium]|uniref:Uncharacterized protein n=1 Tax=uncultured Thermomicrobiales bacterium TaxID=1645740 RepID=A0A6J4U8V2_9BACT|nr:MAG: hypothetical protein AVDCRST_MAG33-240 [uncultured Thermomicrobiales bacterium]